MTPCKNEISNIRIIGEISIPNLGKIIRILLSIGSNNASNHSSVSLIKLLRMFKILKNTNQLIITDTTSKNCNIPNIDITRFKKGTIITSINSPEIYLLSYEEGST